MRLVARLYLDLHVARRVRLHQLVAPDNHVIAAERTLLPMLARLAKLTAEGTTIATDDGKFTIEVRTANYPPAPPSE